MNPQFISLVCALSLLAVCRTYSAAKPSREAGSRSPNVVFVITDDQGYGDLGFTGNPVIKTPHLDKLAGESVWLTDYHVAPSCSPTRSSLLTGRWTNRTGVWHTFFARAMMYEDEVTIADHFQAAGYATGMFGKWHLGDHFPYRPQDRGFDEVYCLKGGAIGVTADYWNNDYFDDRYYHNEEVVQAEGYCTDVFFDAGSRFIRDQVAAEKPFFAYISTNAPHKPWICPPKYSKLYPDQPKPAAAFYGMVTNIDDNVGKLRALLDELGVAENTIFVFTTDNGTISPAVESKAGMRGQKISPYEGGHRVPFALHWPKGGYARHTPVPELTHMVDVLPTLLDLCEIAPAKEALDGRSIRQLLGGQGDDSFNWEERTVLSDTQRIQEPEKWRGSSVMSGKWRLVKGTELYHIGEDPGQTRNVAAKYPERVAAMRQWYENWWAELEPTFARTSEIHIGAEEAPEVVLTALQWIDAAPPWNQGIIRKAPIGGRGRKGSKTGNKFAGHWAVKVVEAGTYTFEVRRWPKESGLKIREGTPPHSPEPGTAPSYSAPSGRAVPIVSATLRIDSEDLETKPITNDDTVIRFTRNLAKGSHKFSPFFTVAGDSGKANSELGAYYMTVSPAADEPAARSASSGQAPPQSDQTSRLPNFVFIMADDLGPGWVDYDGSNPEINTPNLQRLAESGMVFTRAYAAATVCSPTRAACITGMSPAQIGLTTHIPGIAGRERPAPKGGPRDAETLKHLPLELPSYARELKKLGYATGFLGKWHLAGEGSVKTSDGIVNRDYHPEHYGFDSNIGGCAYGQPKSWFDPYRNGTIANRQDGEYLTDRLGDEAASFIQANRDNPFHLSLWFYTVHTPIKAPKDLVKKNGGNAYLAMLESMDNAIGKVLETLETTGTLDYTMVVFYSDNGGHFPTKWLADKKGSMLEGGLRVPMVVSWPAVIEGGTTCDVPVTSMDFFPTFVHAAGGSTAELPQLEGQDLKPLFEGSNKLDRDALYWHYPHNRPDVTYYMGSSILQGDWKLYDGHGVIEDALFNLEDDPMEKKNVLAGNPELAERLRGKLARWLASVDAKMPPPVKK